METETPDAQVEQLEELLRATPSTSTMLLHLLERFVDSQEQIAGAITEIAHAQHRQANAIPELQGDNARWMFRLAEVAVRRWPSEPTKVEDVRIRAAMLGENLGRHFADYAMPEDERRAKWKRERDARDAEAAKNGSSDGEAF